MEHRITTETVLRWFRTGIIFLTTLVICLLLLVLYQNRDMKLSDSINQGYLPQSQHGGGAEPPEGVALTVKESQVSTRTKELAYTITNGSATSYSYGHRLALEIRLGEDWFSVPLQSRFLWDTTLFYLPPNANAELTLDIGGFYQLVPGKYRLVKELIRSPYEQYHDTGYDTYQDDGIFLFAEFEVTG